MKTKLALMLTAVLGATALVASAQTPYRIDPAPPNAPTPTVYSLGAGVPQPPPPPPPGANYVATPVTTPIVTTATAYTFRVSPEEAALAHEADQLARQLSEARSDADRDKLKTKLGEGLEKQFA